MKSDHFIFFPEHPVFLALDPSGTTISQDRFRHIIGGSLDNFLSKELLSSLSPRVDSQLENVISQTFLEAGMKEIQTSYAGNGVEASARKPFRRHLE